MNLRIVTASLLALALGASLALQTLAADDGQMEKVDLGGKPKGPVKPLESKIPGPLAPGGDEDTKPAEAPPLTVPPVEQSRRLVTATLLAFDRAIQTQSFTAFHIEVLSKPFADTYPADKLLETFTPFISAGATLGGVGAVEPEFDPPPAIEDNLLKLRGSFPTRPMRVTFDFDYAFENGNWRVNAMTVNLKGTPPAAKGATPAPGTAGAPSAEEMSKLLADTMADLNAAIQSGGNFEPMLAKASQPMKFQVKPKQLQEAFADFVENKTDLSALAAAQPKFDVGMPKVEGKQLVVSGHYPVNPLFVLFNAEYFKESTGWKLLALSVNTIAPAEFKRGAAVRGDTPAAPESTPAPVAPKPADKKLPAAPGADEAPTGDDMKMKDGTKMEK